MPHQLEHDSLRILQSALEKLDAGFSTLPPIAAHAIAAEEFALILGRVAERLQNNYPYFHPLYAGQMLKPPHPIARTAYALAMWINPNNHALDGSRASSPMEKECVALLAGMFGWKTHLGHLTGGGTVANLEALWVAGRTHPGKTIVASDQSHYTHSRISGVLGLAFDSIPSDNEGRMNLHALDERLQRGDIGTVVATLGTTATGSVDPLNELLARQQEFGFRIHADGAYGGYFTLAENLTTQSRAAYAALDRVDSLVIDPHKHGLQPYGCGCVLFRDPSVGRFYKHDSPYTYFSSGDLHLGEISLECSRAGAAAVALWATMQLMPLERGGTFAASLMQCRAAALQLYAKISADRRFRAALSPELDIVVWAVDAHSAGESSHLAREVFDEAAKRDLHLALAELPVRFFTSGQAAFTRDRETVTCLRSVLMKPEHAAWVDRIWERLDAATDEVLRKKK